MDCAAQSMDPCFAGNPWIAQHLRNPWIATTRHTSSVRAKEEREQGDQSRERKVNRGLPFGWRSSLQVLGELSWISPIRLPSSWTEERIVFTSQENVVELRLYNIDVFRML